jgi:hypothetical protein
MSPGRPPSKPLDVTGDVSGRSVFEVRLVNGRRLPVVGPPLVRRVSRVEHDHKSEGDQEFANGFFPVTHLTKIKI